MVIRRIGSGLAAGRVGLVLSGVVAAVFLLQAPMAPLALRKVLKR